MVNILDDRKRSNQSFTIGSGDVDTSSFATKEDVKRAGESDLLIQYVTSLGGTPLNINSSPDKDAYGNANSGVILNFSAGLIDKFGLWAGAFPTANGFRNRMKITGNSFVDKRITVDFGATAIFNTDPAGIVELIVVGEIRLKNGYYVTAQRIWTSGMTATQREGYLTLAVEHYTFDAPAFAASVVAVLKATGRRFAMPDGDRFLEITDLDVWVSAAIFQNGGTLKLNTCTMYLKKTAEG